jgi:hypothetical protein
MQDDEAPKIVFPCPYPIRVMGEARVDFIERVVEITAVHAPDICRENIKLRDSRKGTFVSVHFIIEAQGEDQLRALHTALKAYDAVKMVL